MIPLEKIEQLNLQHLIMVMLLLLIGVIQMLEYVHKFECSNSKG